jgi:hypothetical protein
MKKKAVVGLVGAAALSGLWVLVRRIGSKIE